MNDDRGQLILVTGLAVAVTLVALVLLLNTVIYTQNLATRGAQIEDGEAIAFRGEVIADVGGLLDAENREEYDSWGKARDNATEAVARYDRLLSRYHAEHGTVAEIERGSLSLTEGVVLRQTNASRELRSSDASGAAADWTAAGNVQSTRAFELTVPEENLTAAADPSGLSISVAGNDGNDWQAYLYNDSDDDGDGYSGITVAVKNGTESSATEVCSASGPEATVDLTRGTMNGSSCPGLVWATGVDAPYDITVTNGGQATGTYALTVDSSTADTDVKTANFASPGAEESPRWAPAVYAAEFEIHFETPRVAFHTTVRTAPGEPR